MWNEENAGMGSIMAVLFIIIVIWAIFGGGFGGIGNRGYDNCGCGCITNCEVQKQEIIDNARNLYASEQNANRVIANNDANTQRLFEQSSRQYEAALQAELFDAKMKAQTDVILKGQELASKDAEIYALKGQIYTDAKFNELARGQEHIMCEMPKRPPYFSQGFITCGQPIPTGCGC